MTSSRPARATQRRPASAGLPAPSRAIEPRSVVVRGYAIPVGRVVLGVLIGVAIGGAHLSVHSLAAYKEGVKQGLRTEIGRLERENYEKEKEVERAARTALERFEWEGASRLPVEGITAYEPDKQDGVQAQGSSAGLPPGGGLASEANDGWYRSLVWKVKEVISFKGGRAE